MNIASLYEYFPGKDAIVAQVAERHVLRVLAHLAEALPRVFAAPEDDATRLWIQIVYETVLAEKDLSAVFQREIPYRNQLPAFQALSARLLEFSHGMQTQANRPFHEAFTPVTMHLLNNLVSSTIMQIILDPPDGISRDELLDELARRVEQWIRPPL